MISSFKQYSVLALTCLSAVTHSLSIPLEAKSQSYGEAAAVNIASAYDNAVYFVNWAIYARNHHAQELPASKLTHVIYAFANLRPNGTVFMTDSFADVEKRYPTDSLNATGTNMYGSIKQLYLHKKKNRQMKTLLSVGGWTYSPTFPNATSTEATRAEFVRSAVKLVTDHGFDGLDIDWEYPTNAVEATNFVSLVKALREGFDAHSAAHASGYHFLITAATSAGPLKYNILKLGEMNKYVDKFFLMAYEYSGAFSNFTGHDANLYLSKKNPTSTEFDTQSAIAGYLAAGVTPSKLVMGMPLYGKSFLNTDGLGKTYNGTGPGSWEAGIWDYKALPKVGAIEHYAHEVVGSFSYDNATRELISYDTVKSVTAKSDYIMEKGLGGAMFWESSMDKTGNQSLLGATQSALANLDQSQNLLDYSTSPYANLVAGMPNE